MPSRSSGSGWSGSSSSGIPTLSGLQNLGNTCFLNSVLQALNATHPLPELLTQPSPSTADASTHPLLTYLPGPSTDPEHPPSPIPITLALAHLFRQLGKGDGTSLKPTSLLKELGKKREEYADYDQQDAHELLRVLVDGLRMEELDLWKKVDPPPVPSQKGSHPKVGKGAEDRHASSSSYGSSEASTSSPSSDDEDQGSDGKGTAPPPPKREPLVDTLFCGALTQFIVCSSCRHVSRTTEDFLDLSLSLQPGGSGPASDVFDEGRRIGKRERLRRSIQERLRASAAERKRKGPGTSMSAAPSDASDASDGGDDEAGRSRRRSMDLGMLGVGGKGRKGFWSGKPSREASPSGRGPEGGDGKLSRKTSKRGFGGWRSDRSSTTSAESSSHASMPVSKPSPEKEAYLNRVLAEVPAPTPVNALGAHGGLQALRFSHPDPTRNAPSPTASSSSTTATSHTSTPSKPNADAPAGSDTQLYTLLRQFTSVETLDGENVFACRNCWRLSHRASRGRAATLVPSLRAASTRSASQPGQPAEASDADSGLGSDSAGSRPPSKARLSSAVVSRLGVEQSSAESLGATPKATPLFSEAKEGMMTASKSTASLLVDAGEGQMPAKRPSLMLTTPSGNAEDYTEERTAKPRDKDGQESDLFTSDPEPNEADVESDANEADVNATVKHRRRKPKPPLATLAPVSSLVSSAGSTSIPVSPEPRPPPPPEVPKPLRYVLRPAEKRYLVSSLPPILVVHLKRFGQAAGSSSKMASLFNRNSVNNRGFGASPGSGASFSDFRKIDDFVSFPERLDLGAFLAPPPLPRRTQRRMTLGSAKAVTLPPRRQHLRPWLAHLLHHRKSDESTQQETPDSTQPPASYRLYATVNHIGTLGAGHYIANVLSDRWRPDTTLSATAANGEAHRQRRWMYVSDTTIRMTTLEDVLKSKAYVLFYERIDLASGGEE